MDDRILSYDELRLWLEGGDGSYRVRAEGPDGRRASGTFSPPFDEVHLDNFVLRVGRRTRTVRAYRSSQMEQAKGFGQQLFDSIITGDVRDLYLTACGISESRGRGLRITLFLTEAPDLMGIPWEFMYERPSFLAQSIYTPIVRSFDFKNPRAPRRLSPPLRVLGMASSPLGFDTLDAGQERSKLENALHGLMAAGLVEFSWLERPTLGELERVLSASDELHVLHYIGHGAYDERVAGGYLVLENDRGDPHEVSGEELGSLLYDKRSMRLAVLNACEGARSSHVDPFSGVASSLVEHGIPAVIGMQFEITDSAAVTFTGRLYDALTDGFPVDAALAQARKAIWAASRPQATISSSALRCCSCAPPTPASSTSSAPARRTPWPWASPLRRRADLAGAEAAWRAADGRGSAAAAYELGVLLHDRGDYEGAEAAYRRAEERGNSDGAAGLGFLLQLRWDLEGAEAAFRRAERGGSAEGTAGLGTLLREQGDLDGAEAAYRRADQGGGRIGAVNLGAVLLMERGDLDGAEAAGRRAEERGSADAGLVLGLVLKQRGDLQAAMAAFDRAEECGSVDGAALLGLMLQEAGDEEGAEAAYRRADERGGSIGPWCLAMLLQQRGDLDGAEARLPKGCRARQRRGFLVPRYAA